MKTALWALVLTLVLAAPTAMASEWRRPAGDAIVVGSTLVAFTPDFRAVVGLDPATSSRKWRTPLSAEVRGPQSLQRVDGRVAVISGDTVRLVEPATGKVLGTQRPGMFANVAAPGCALVAQRGACALDCPCSFQLVRCDDLGAIGPREQLPQLESRTPEGGWETVCPGRRGDLIGRVGDRVLASVPDASAGPFVIGGNAVVAKALADGAEVWRKPALGRVRADAKLSGVAADGARCWVGDLAGRLAVFDCASGATRWRAAHSLPKDTPAQVQATSAGTLLVRDGDQVQAKRLESGHVAWAIHAPDALVVTAVDTLGDLWLGPLSKVRLVRAETGETAASMVAPAGAQRRVSSAPGGGWLIATDRALRKFDASGKQTGEIALKPVNDVIAGASLVAVRGADMLTFLTADTLLPVGEHRGPLSVIAVDAGVGRGRAVIFRHADAPFDPSDPESFGEIELLRLR